MVKRKTKAQSVTEYAILIGVVIGAFAAMQVYVRRRLNAGIAGASDTVVNALGGREGLTLTLGTGDDAKSINTALHREFEPDYTMSSSTTFSESHEDERIDSGTITSEAVSASGQAKGSFRAERRAQTGW